ncbi:hypothetical protein FPV67DRAFT_1701107 [Lyophyllum atratum]|nr:hypothetical protein FPV67DRAFT_1701107 [Lyophyllum atratum]
MSLLSEAERRGMGYHNQFFVNKGKGEGEDEAGLKEQVEKKPARRPKSVSVPTPPKNRVGKGRGEILVPKPVAPVPFPAIKKKAISRPGALHLTLPLVERHSYAYSCDSEENLITLASSRYTISAAPKTSASMYSQESYHISPPMFSETRVNRRRFGLAMTPLEEGPWKRAVQPRSAAVNVFVLDLKSATVDVNPFLGSDEEGEDAQWDLEEAREGQQAKMEVKMVMEEMVLPVIGRPMEVGPPRMIEEKPSSKEAHDAKKKKSRMSSRVIGKMISRLSVHPSSSRPIDTEDQPLLPALPPQILMTLPSPSLRFMESSQDAPSTKDDLHALALQKHEAVPRNRSTLPSTWKPRRPPSPLPKALRKQNKHKRNATSLSHLVVASPPPPLPPRVRPALVELPLDKAGAFQSFSTPSNSAADVMSPGQDWSRWDDIRLRLRARALKSSGYAIHDGGIISPTSS